MMKWLLLTSMILLTSCAGSSGGNECTWAKKSVVEDGFEERWTPAEIRGAVAHDRKVEQFCR